MTHPPTNITTEAITRNDASPPQHVSVLYALWYPFRLAQYLSFCSWATAIAAHMI